MAFRRELIGHHSGDTSVARGVHRGAIHIFGAPLRSPSRLRGVSSVDYLALHTRIST